MKNASPNSQGFGGLVTALSSFVKRIASDFADIAVFADTKAYKAEIARYESELQPESRYDRARLRNAEADGQEAATS